MKLISVVIPVLNRAELILRTLDSIAGQTGCQFAVIVVDNGSDDGTPEAVHRWAEAHRDGSLSITLLSETTPGAAAARNRGLVAVRTPYVMFFDSDDRMLPGHMARVCAALEAYPEADIIGWDTVNSTGKRLVFAADPWDLLFRGGMATQRWAARTSAVRRAGGWNPSLSLWDDIELGARLLAPKPAVVKLEGEPTVEVTLRPDSITMREHSLDSQALLSALDAMAVGLPELKPLVPFKIAIVAGNNARRNPSEARKLLAHAITLAPQHKHKLTLIWQLARTNIPGITHITKRLILQR